MEFPYTHFLLLTFWSTTSIPIPSFNFALCQVLPRYVNKGPPTPSKGVEETIWKLPEDVKERCAIVLQAGGLKLGGKDAEAAMGTKIVLLRNAMVARLDEKQVAG